MRRKDAIVLQSIAEALWPSLPAEAEQARQSGDEALAEYYSTAGFFDGPGQAELVRGLGSVARMLPVVSSAQAILCVFPLSML
jgi:hypothetical protein